jgi:hypothetical protein
MFGLVGLDILESLRLTASDVLDTKSWGEGGGIFLAGYRMGVGAFIG